MRTEVVYIGRVQGVGFRATAHALAQQHRLVGWVRNEPDGSVRVVVEGPAAAVDRFLGGLNSRMGQYISNSTMEQGEDRGGYSGFEIKY